MEINKSFVLLVVAHRAEANIIIKDQRFSFEHYSLASGDIFYDAASSLCLLITGEGLWKAITVCSAFFALYSKKISNVINFGIAGSIERRCAIDDVFAIRTVYGSSAERHFEYHSFRLETFDMDAVDLVSCGYRVKSTDVANPLRAYGELVDRELWAIAYVANIYKIGVHSIKIVSDQIIKTCPGDSCSSIQERVEVQISRVVPRVFKLIEQLKMRIPPKNTESEITKPISLFEDLYFTVSMRHRFDELMTSYMIKQNIPNITDAVSEIREKYAQEFQRLRMQPKQKASMLIKNLNQLIHPPIKQHELDSKT